MKYQEITLPNWCNGYVQVSGKPENVKSFCKLFVFEDEKDIKDEKEEKYFARSFVNQKWKDFEKEYSLGKTNDVEFSVDFAWSAWSCLIEGYPQEFKKKCLTLKSACKKYDVKVEITTEEPSMCFEEEIKADKKGVKYSEKKMKTYECICGESQAISNDVDLSEIECYECGKVGQYNLLREV
jgi:hypothetical protein